MLPVSLFRSHLVPRSYAMNNPALVRSSVDTAAMRHRKISPAAASWSSTPHANYYYDAARQTVKTMRVLLKNNNAHSKDLGLRPNTQLLTNSFENLLLSLRPGLLDDEQSRAKFTALLRMHLADLTPNELSSLSQALKSSRFMCYVTESVIDDEVYLKFGFSNGPPHCADRTLLDTTGLYRLLDDMQQEAVKPPGTTPLSVNLSSALAQAARSMLADGALQWQQSNKTLATVHHITCQLAQALTLPVSPETIISKIPPTPASTIGWEEGTLQIDPKIAAQLSEDKHGTLFVRVMRDILELLLTKKLFGENASPQKLSENNKVQLHDAIDLVTDQCAPMPNAELSQHAQTVLKQAACFGKMQIIPTTGVALGHAWIAPSLSVTPNRLVRSNTIGTRFMRTGFEIEPAEKIIHEWPVKFLSQNEHEELYPAESAWHLSVPASQTQLQAAADKVKREWHEQGLTYRFAGTTPALQATGCRTAVWQAIRLSLDADALVLFDHYNRGLHEPDSPTELWTRMHGLMQWMEQLARN